MQKATKRPTMNCHISASCRMAGQPAFVRIVFIQIRFAARPKRTPYTLDAHFPDTNRTHSGFARVYFVCKLNNHVNMTGDVRVP